MLHVYEGARANELKAKTVWNECSKIDKSKNLVDELALARSSFHAVYYDNFETKQIRNTDENINIRITGSAVETTAQMLYFAKIGQEPFAIYAKTYNASQEVDLKHCYELAKRVDLSNYKLDSLPDFKFRMLLEDVYMYEESSNFGIKPEQRLLTSDKISRYSLKHLAHMVIRTYNYYLDNHRLHEKFNLSYRLDAENSILPKQVQNYAELDLLSTESIIDIKVSNQYKLQNMHILQILSYFIIGTFSNNKDFAKVRYIGTFNPRFNTVQVADLTGVREIKNYLTLENQAFAGIFPLYYALLKHYYPDEIKLTRSFRKKIEEQISYLLEEGEHTNNGRKPK